MPSPRWSHRGPPPRSPGPGISKYHGPFCLGPALHPGEEFCLLGSELTVGEDAGVPQFGQPFDLIDDGSRWHCWGHGSAGVVLDKGELAGLILIGWNVLHRRVTPAGVVVVTG